MRLWRIPLVALLPLAAACSDSVAPDAIPVVDRSLSTAKASYPLVTITPAIEKMALGERLELRTTITDSRGRTQPGEEIEWLTSDNRVIRVAEDDEDEGDYDVSIGILQARKVGTATITARTDEGTTAKLTIVVVDGPVDRSEPDSSATKPEPGKPQPDSGSTKPEPGKPQPEPGKPQPDPGTTPEPDSSTVLPPTPDDPVGPRVGYYVSPNGSSSGNGSFDRPWNLTTALAHPSAVQPGDTIWMRGGTYRGAFRSRLSGSGSRHVVLRQYPGERATIDGSLFVEGSSATYWGFEVMNSSSSRPDVIGVDIRGPRTRFVNLVVHDHGSNGMGFWTTAPDAEIYGSIIYNNGVQGPSRGHGHGIYAQNSSGTKRIADNVIFNQFGYGIHIFGSSAVGLRGFDIDGNVSFNNGSISRTGNAPDIYVGGGSPAERINVTGNMTYQQAGKTTVVFGDNDSAINRDLVMRDNQFIGTTKLAKWGTVSATGNTFAGAESILFLTLASGQSTSSYDWNRNSYFSLPSRWAPFSYITSSGTKAVNFANWKSNSRLDGSSTYALGNPSGTRVVVRPNRYEAGRATVVVYNWSGQGSASVNVSSILPAGSRYEVRNVQNYYGSPVASGTYGGGSINIPLSGVTPAAPVGGSASAPPRTGSAFNVFVITKVEEGAVIARR